jgi:HSP20 family molecular chaperone IbpA
MRPFSKYVRPILIGLSCFLLGAACLFAFFRLSPDTGRTLLGEQENHHSSKPIVSAFNLAPHKEDDEEAQPAPPQAPATPQQGAQANRANPMAPFFDDDDADFFGGQDPFAAARKLHEQIQKQMAAGMAGMGGAGGVIDLGSSEQITKKEDAKSLSYEIKGVEGSSLNTSVQDGYLTIRGETKRQAGGMSIQSSFQRSFPLPRNVDPTKMETISEKDMVVLRFPKRSG